MGFPSDAVVDDQGAATKVDDHLLCSICFEVLDDPVSPPCGHSYCRSCVEKTSSCPTCRGAKEPLVPNRIVRSLVAGLRLKCPNGIAAAAEPAAKRARGVGGDLPACAWVGATDALAAHRAECPREIVACSFAGCSHKDARGRIVAHAKECPMRWLRCLKCSNIMTAASFPDHQKNTCPKRQVLCPSCAASMPHDEQRSHLGVCPAVVVKCPLADLGCAHTGPRRDLKTHADEASLEHLRLFSASHAAQRRRIDELEKGNAELWRDLGAKNVDLSDEVDHLLEGVDSLRKDVDASNEIFLLIRNEDLETLEKGETVSRMSPFWVGGRQWQLKAEKQNRDFVLLLSMVYGSSCHTSVFFWVWSDDLRRETRQDLAFGYGEEPSWTQGAKCCTWLQFKKIFEKHNIARCRARFSFSKYGE